MSVKVELDNAIYSHIVTEAFENGSNVKVSGTITTANKSIKLINSQIERLDWFYYYKINIGIDEFSHFVLLYLHVIAWR